MIVAEYVVDFLIKNGYETVFYTPGGGIGPLTNALIGKKIKAIALHHEQAVTFACEAYYKATGKVAVAFLTSGVGAVNGLQGMASAYSDKVPMFVITGDMPHINIVEMATPITYYSQNVLIPDETERIIKNANDYAHRHREPVLINVPFLVQKSDTESSFGVVRTNPITKKIYKRITPSKFKKGDYVDPYSFVKSFEKFKGNLVFGIGVDVIAALQVLKRKFIYSANYGAMGFCVPAAIGAYYANHRPTVLITGDGSFLLNMQELEVIGRKRLPIKIFIFNNKGYGAMRRSQIRDFGRQIGTEDFQVDYWNIARAFGLDMSKIDNNDRIQDIKHILSNNIPELIEVSIDPNFKPEI